MTRTTTIVAGYDVALDMSPLTDGEVEGMARRAREIAQDVEGSRPDLALAASRYADELDLLAADPQDVDALQRAEAALDVFFRLQRPKPGMLEVRSAGGVQPSNAELLAQIKALQAQVARLEAAHANGAAPAVEHRPAPVRETRRMQLEPMERERRRAAAGELNAAKGTATSAKRREVVRLALVALERPLTGGGMWKLQDVRDLDRLAVAVLDNWSSHLQEPALSTIGEWLRASRAAGELHGRYVSTPGNT